MGAASPGDCAAPALLPLPSLPKGTLMRYDAVQPWSFELGDKKFVLPGMSFELLTQMEAETQDDKTGSKTFDFIEKVGSKRTADALRKNLPPLRLKEFLTDWSRGKADASGEASGSDD